MPSQSLRDAICEAADKVTAEAVTTRMIEEIRKAAADDPGPSPLHQACKVHDDLVVLFRAMCAISPRSEGFEWQVEYEIEKRVTRYIDKLQIAGAIDAARSEVSRLAREEREARQAAAR